MVDANQFYDEYHGHPVQMLRELHERMVLIPRRSGQAVRCVFLVGDSSFDNKYWLSSWRTAVNGFENVLQPARSKPDIAHFLNEKFAGMRRDPSVPRYVCLNCAVEESTIGVRRRGKALLPQDTFVQDVVTPDDVVISSLGGNDIALRPTPGTVASLLWLTCCSSTSHITDGSAWGLDHLRELFFDDYAKLLKRAFATRPESTPRLLMPCIIYYPDMNPKAPSWANLTLKAIGYNKNPKHVQAMTDRIFQEALTNLTPSTLGMPRVVPVALSRALDGSNTADYVARVEPSVQGGEKVAQLLFDALMQHVDS